ncbi:MAG: FtsX-like permease family protein [Coprococcus sp.]|nr:FtsX-like permease family protein [Coprococcus sp.]
MNIFHKTALKGLKKNRSRTFVTIVGVVLSSALITAISVFVVSLQNYLVNGAIVKYGDWHVMFTDVPSSFIEEHANEEDVKKTASFANIGYAMLEGGKNEYKPYLFIAGFYEDTFDTLPLQLNSGRLPKNSKEVLVPSHVMANGGVPVSIGDTLSLKIGTRQSGEEKLSQHDPYRAGEESFLSSLEQDYTVVGIYQRPGFEEYSAPGYTLVTLADPKSSPGSFSMFVSLQHPTRVRAYVRHMGEDLPYALNNEVLRFLGLSDDKLFNTLLYSIGGILIALVILGSIFMIYNSFSISLAERMQQFGILMSVGATTNQIRSSVLFEGICIGSVGIPCGILLGVPSIGLVLSLTEHIFSRTIYDNVPLTLTISVPVIAASAAVSMATILVSAYVPARKAARIPVMECIRQTNEIKTDAKTVKISRLSGKLYGLPGILALKNFKRCKRRYRSTVLSLMLSVILFVSSSSFTLYLGQEAKASIIVGNHELFEQNRNILFIVNLFTVVFIIMISLIAMANVFNTISTNIRLRRQELAMIRSVGMSDHDFSRMMRFECIFYGLRTLLFSLPLSALLSHLIYIGMCGGSIGGGDELHYIFPWRSLTISLCGVFVIIFITTLYTVRKIKKENIIDALRDDIV